MCYRTINQRRCKFGSFRNRQLIVYFVELLSQNPYRWADSLISKRLRWYVWELFERSRDKLNVTIYVSYFNHD